MAQWSTKYISSLGFECVIILENADFGKLIEKAERVQRAIRKHGGKPVTSRPILGPGRIPIYSEQEEKKAIEREFRRRN